jgi:hypothetical protein
MNFRADNLRLDKKEENCIIACHLGITLARAESKGSIVNYVQ